MRAAVTFMVTPGASRGRALPRKSSGMSQPVEPVRAGESRVMATPPTTTRRWFRVNWAEREPTVSVPRVPLTVQEPLRTRGEALGGHIAVAFIEAYRGEGAERATLALELYSSRTCPLAHSRDEPQEHEAERDPTKPGSHSRGRYRPF